jgi:acyl carrier protein
MISTPGEVTPNKQEMENRVIQLVASTLGHKPRHIKPTTPLLSSQISFDSFALMEFVLRLENAFGLTIPDEDLDPDVFYSVETIISYLRVRLEQED